MILWKEPSRPKASRLWCCSVSSRSRAQKPWLRASSRPGGSESQWTRRAWRRLGVPPGRHRGARRSQLGSGAQKVLRAQVGGVPAAGHAGHVCVCWPCWPVRTCMCTCGPATRHERLVAVDLSHARRRRVAEHPAQQPPRRVDQAGHRDARRRGQALGGRAGRRGRRARDRSEVAAAGPRGVHGAAQVDEADGPAVDDAEGLLDDQRTRRLPVVVSIVPVPAGHTSAARRGSVGAVCRAHEGAKCAVHTRVPQGSCDVGQQSAPQAICTQQSCDWPMLGPTVQAVDALCEAWANA